MPVTLVILARLALAVLLLLLLVPFIGLERNNARRWIALPVLGSVASVMTSSDAPSGRPSSPAKSRSKTIACWIDPRWKSGSRPPTP